MMDELLRQLSAQADALSGLRAELEMLARENRRLRERVAQLEAKLKTLAPDD